MVGNLPLVALLLAAAPGPPPGMVRLPAGAFYMGRDAGGRDDEHPRHRVRLPAFDLDATLVTVADFRAFVEATGYRTSAERLGYGMVAYEGLADWEWRKAPGASWRRPFGDLAAVAPRDDEPVLVVSHLDARAYCAHQGKRLPTEAEWEYAMRAGSEARFPWGAAPQAADGGYLANFWQGETHAHNARADGFLYASPVRAFPPNAWGVYDPVGNVWQWTADWYSPTYFVELARAGEAVDPKGPGQGTHRVARGGSWWCSTGTCDGFGLFFRGKMEARAAFNNVGFRCARDVGK